jgi:hypothetical protein
MHRRVSKLFVVPVRFNALQNASQYKTVRVIFLYPFKKGYCIEVQML